MAPYVICIDGNIGAGKSTLLRELQNRGYVVFREDVHDWMWALGNCYSDSKRWACTLQIAVLKSMASQKNRIDESTSEIVLVERCPVSTMAFTNAWYDQGCLTDDELRLVQKMYDALAWVPNVTIMLTTSPDKCYERMVKRGRECESSVQLSHLLDVKNQYDKVYASRENVISVDTDEDVGVLATNFETIIKQLREDRPRMQTTISASDIVPQHLIHNLDRLIDEWLSHDDIVRDQDVFGKILFRSTAKSRLAEAQNQSKISSVHPKNGP